MRLVKVASKEVRASRSTGKISLVIIIILFIINANLLLLVSIIITGIKFPYCSLCPRCDHDNDHVQGGSHHGSYLEHWVSDLGGQGAFIVIVIVTHVISGDGKSAEEQHLDKHCHSLGAA